MIDSLAASACKKVEALPLNVTSGEIETYFHGLGIFLSGANDWLWAVPKR